MTLKRNSIFRGALLLAGAAALSACGGGSGGGSRPSPTPTPTPTPTPRTTPTQAELDAETAVSNAVVSSNADTAHARGFTGAGQLVSIMDTGALGFLETLSDNSGTGPNAPDLVFEDRLSADSKKLWGTDTPTDFTQHGTLVTAVIGAAQDGRGMHGVAPGADLLYYDYGDYCLDSTCNEDQWQESFERYRVGMQEAIDLGAIVMNFSLGEDRFPVRMIETTANAVAADMIIVISAGNDGQADPHAMAQGFATLAPDHTIIAGAINSAGNPASFTNLAGVSADNYLMALGVNVVTYDNSGNLVTANGTSLSAPVITGAVALLAEAFPSLTGAEIVDILFESADDAGAPGTDPVYGRGILNIEAAFAPLGTTSVAGTNREALDLFGGTASPAMGDASGVLEGVAITDKYDRAFSADLGGFAMQAGITTPLRSLAQEGVESRSLSLGGHRFGFATAQRPALGSEEARREILSAQVDLELDDVTRVAFSMGQGISQFEGDRAIGMHFLTDGPTQRSGFHAKNAVGSTVSTSFAGFDVNFGGETGAIARGNLPWLVEQDDRYAKLQVMAGRDIGPMRLSAGLSRLDEEATLLGGSLTYLDGGTTSDFIDAGASLALGGWTLAGEWRRGWSRVAAQDALFTGGTLTSSGWAVKLGNGPFGLRVSQPLRVDGGGLAVFAPTSFDYETMSAGFEHRLVSLSPSGREIDVEAAYGLRIGNARLDANVFWRREPGHIASMPDDKGVALRFRSPL